MNVTIDRPVARSPRRMPTLKKLLEHHDIDPTNPYCFKCGIGTRRLERAHVIDRWMGGLDNMANLRPLCPTCHRLQPMFEPGQEDEALAWFEDHTWPVFAIIREAMEKAAADHGETVEEFAEQLNAEYAATTRPTPTR